MIPARRWETCRAACCWPVGGRAPERGSVHRHPRTLVAHAAHASLRCLPTGAESAEISAPYVSCLLLIPLVGAACVAVLGGASAAEDCGGALASACTFFLDFFFFDDVALPLPCSSSNALNVLAIATRSQRDHTLRREQDKLQTSQIWRLCARHY